MDLNLYKVKHDFYKYGYIQTHILTVEYAREALIEVFGEEKSLELFTDIDLNKTHADIMKYIDFGLKSIYILEHQDHFKLTETEQFEHEEYIVAVIPYFKSVFTDMNMQIDEDDPAYRLYVYDVTEALDQINTPNKPTQI